MSDYGMRHPVCGHWVTIDQKLGTDRIVRRMMSVLDAPWEYPCDEDPDCKDWREGGVHAEGGDRNAKEDRPDILP